MKRQAAWVHSVCPAAVTTPREAFSVIQKAPQAFFSPEISKILPVDLSVRR